MVIALNESPSDARAVGKVAFEAPQSLQYCMGNSNSKHL